jgi:hypothetical protein
LLRWWSAAMRHVPSPNTCRRGDRLPQ